MWRITSPVSRPGKSAGPRFFMTAMVQVLLLPGFEQEPAEDGRLGVPGQFGVKEA
jgi:hypothetical protein